MINKIINYFKDNWSNSKYLFIMDNVSMVFGVMAATTLTIMSGKDNINWKFIYETYTISSIAGILYSLERKTIPLFILNFCYLIVNFIGLLKAFQFI